MTSQVYYRKWRPKHFGDVVGQDHVSTTLLQAIRLKRIAHSYLLCGPRGTGKTSTARVFAKAVNCSNSEDGNPCDLCTTCEAINEGRFMDLIELDAASNRGIDEIRGIRDRVNLAPVEGSYKVYIIDESHMLTEHASNAFLKTLEEPPPHAIFILCTTEPHKILPTIISRCQRFDFHRITSDHMISRLKTVCDKEAINVDDDALMVLAKASSGSLRDAENLLEQVVVSYGQRIESTMVNSMLGWDRTDTAFEFVKSLLMLDTSGSLKIINQSVSDGADIKELHRQCVEILRAALMISYGNSSSVDFPKDTIIQIGTLIEGISTEIIMAALKGVGQTVIKHETISTLPLELAAIEICEGKYDGHKVDPELNQRNLLDDQTSRAHTSTNEIPVETKTSDNETRYTEEYQESPISSTFSPPNAPDSLIHKKEPQPLSNKQWDNMVKALSRVKGRRFNMGALLRDCKDYSIENNIMTLVFTHRSHLERMREELDDPQCAKSVNGIVREEFGNLDSIELELSESGTQEQTSVTPNNSPLLRVALNMGARIVEEHKP